MEARYRQLDPEQYPVLAAALGDTPESVISVHQLTRGIAAAYVAGDPAHFHGALIHHSADPGEPVAFGADAAVLWELLQRVQGWGCVNVPDSCAHQLGQLIAAETGTRVRYYGDIYHTLTTPVVPFHHSVVRPLTLDDLALLEAAPDEVRGGNWESTCAMIETGIVAGAVVTGRLVAIAFTAALTPKHADIGVSTLADWRGQGLATAAAALVAARVQAVGKTPVWSTGEDNWASLRVAQKLGFTPVAQRTYLIPT